MAEAVRVLGGEELHDARVGVVWAWILLAGGIFAFARYSQFSNLWYGALLVSLVFPHAVEATATLLTEGPALLFALLGVLAWTEFATRPNVTRWSLVLGVAGGLAIGISVTCRQYNMALIPAAALVTLYQFRQHLQSSTRQKRVWLASTAVTLFVAALPVVMLVMVWKGFSSPGMAAKTSYSNWQAVVGLNIFRPLIAAFYVAVYLVPLTFPAMARVRKAMRLRGVVIALIGGVVAGLFGSSWLTPGPLRTILGALARFPGAQGVLLALVTVVATYNMYALGLLLWEKRDLALACPPIVFALLTTVFFIAEQVGVGGNIPFYDRYLLIVSPFLGLIAFSALPRITCPRLLALIIMSAGGHMILWRYAFGR